ncbi:MAG: AEC family transporter [Eubacteriales bacterium]|nr:AEC family transporter [Eubacteriales bacterium]
MNMSSLYTQIAVMFLLICVGAICYRRKMITDDGSAQMSSLLMTFVMPCIIIHSFHREFDPSMFGKLIETLVLSAILLLISIVIATLAFRKDTPDYADKRMCVIFSNNGFMALPLLQAVCGEDGVFIGSINIVATNILIWTYGVWLLTRASGRSTSGVNWKKIFLNPGTIGLFIGLLIFMTSFHLPTILDDAISFLSDLNTPLAMIVLGVYLAQSNLLDVIKDRSVYVVSLFRLVVIPLIAIAMVYFLPFDHSVSNALVISIATPCAVASSMFAQMFGTNYHYSSRIIAFSTLLSAISMPVVLGVYQLLLG